MATLAYLPAKMVNASVTAHTVMSQNATEILAHVVHKLQMMMLPIIEVVMKLTKEGFTIIIA